MRIPKKDEIPFELQERNQWINWTEEKRNEEITKVPLCKWKNPKTGKP